MSKPFVQFAHVEKTYDGVQTVVHDLNIDIAKGEFLTLLGPSGSGKTTTLMMLAGFETATAGEIYLDGKPINAIALPTVGAQGAAGHCQREDCQGPGQGGTQRL
jgi:putative spermidine/putrescine transport system ATP-binding protein